jgi:hypothetical protein
MIAPVASEALGRHDWICTIVACAAPLKHLKTLCSLFVAASFGSKRTLLIVTFYTNCSTFLLLNALIASCTTLAG